MRLGNHAGIPTFDPATDAEKERFAPSGNNNGPVKNKFSAEDR
jgi:hypothetical protein